MRSSVTWSKHADRSGHWSDMEVKRGEKRRENVKTWKTDLMAV